MNFNSRFFLFSFSFIFVSYFGGIESDWRACTIKPLTAVINTTVMQNRVFVTACHLHPSLTFLDKTSNP